MFLQNFLQTCPRPSCLLFLLRLRRHYFFCRPPVIQQAVSWSMRIVDKCISILERSCEMLLGESTASGKLSLASVLTLITVAGCFCRWAIQSYIVTPQEWRARSVAHRSYFQPVGQSNIVDFNDFKRERFTLSHEANPEKGERLGGSSGAGGGSSGTWVRQ